MVMTEIKAITINKRNFTKTNNISKENFTWGQFLEKVLKTEKKMFFLNSNKEANKLNLVFLVLEM
jgi:hypothetical protein